MHKSQIKVNHSSLLQILSTIVKTGLSPGALAAQLWLARGPWRQPCVWRVLDATAQQGGQHRQDTQMKLSGEEGNSQQPKSLLSRILCCIKTGYQQKSSFSCCFEQSPKGMQRAWQRQPGCSMQESSLVSTSSVARHQKRRAKLSTKH